MSCLWGQMRAANVVVAKIPFGSNGGDSLTLFGQHEPEQTNTAYGGEDGDDTIVVKAGLGNGGAGADNLTADVYGDDGADIRLGHVGNCANTG